MKKIMSLLTCFVLLFCITEPAYAKGGVRVSPSVRTSPSVTNKSVSPKPSTPKSTSTKTTTKSSSNNKTSHSKNATSKQNSALKSDLRNRKTLAPTEIKNYQKVENAKFDGLPVFLTAAGTYFILSSLDDDGEEMAFVIDEEEITFAGEQNIDLNSFLWAIFKPVLILGLLAVVLLSVRYFVKF